MMIERSVNLQGRHYVGAFNLQGPSQQTTLTRQGAERLHLTTRWIAEMRARQLGKLAGVGRSLRVVDVDVRVPHAAAQSV